ncbi:hypothetical protein Tco_0809391, partial [Tanacetum coccineum]
VASNDLRDALSVIFGLSVTQVISAGHNSHVRLSSLLRLPILQFHYEGHDSWSIPSAEILTRRLLDISTGEHGTTTHRLTPPHKLPIPIPIPSTARRVDIPEADMPPRKRLLLTAPRPRCEVRESSAAAAAARQPGPTMARRVDCSSVDTVETRVRDTERRMMAALEVVNLRVSYQVDVRSRKSS